ncbi:hypothetical protein LBM341_02449 [Ralstonia solanacearum]|nr:hypothetical protein LBM341_02449 [Ralstonia solanacearum]NJZ83530.1 hypothetical protein [Ralstonia solanacearum]NKA13269.1 hypothetical protein [Ralstonia solanacearum]
MDRDDAAVIDHDRGRFLQQPGALLVVHGVERLVEHRVHLRVAVLAPVDRTVALPGILARHQRPQRRADLARLRAPAHQPERILVPDALGREGRHRHALHLGHDADARQVLRDGLRDLLVVHVPVVGRVQRDAEAVRIARLGQQFLRALRIVLEGLQVRVIAEQLRWHQVVGRLRQALHDAVLDALAVDRHAHRATHARVLERILGERLAVLTRHVRRRVTLVVRIQIDDAVRDLREKIQRCIPAHARQVRRRHVLDRLHVPRQQRRDARRAVGNEAQRHLVPSRFRAPVLVVAHQLDTVVPRVADELERPGADHALALREVIARQSLRRLLLHDEHRGQVRQHQRIRLRGRQLDRVLVDDLLVDDCLGVGIELARTVDDGRRPVERPRHILRRQLAAIMELHARP